MKRLTIEVTQERHTQLKVYAAECGLSMSAVVNALLASALSRVTMSVALSPKKRKTK